MTFPPWVCRPTHIRQHINHEGAAALSTLNELANRHGATQEVIFVVQKLYSAALEIPAYTAQYRYLKELSKNTNSNAMIGFEDGNELKQVKASKYGAEQMKELTAEGHPFREELWKANILIGEMASSAFVAECCAFIKSDVKSSEIFDVRKLFSNCPR